MTQENLQPVRSESEARQKGKAGGIASGEARRRKRDLRLALLALLDGEENGQTGAERLAAALWRKGLDGDIKAIMEIDRLTQEGRVKSELPDIDLNIFR